MVGCVGNMSSRGHHQHLTEEQETSNKMNYVTSEEELGAVDKTVLFMLVLNKILAHTNAWNPLTDYTSCTVRLKPRKVNEA